MSAPTDIGRLRRTAALVALALAALIHLLPAPGLFGGHMLQGLYHLPELDPASELLLRHRAWMFMLMGGFLLSALVVRAWRVPAILVLLLSDIGFLVLCLMGSDLNPAMQRVLAFDVASILLLLLGSIGLRVHTDVDERKRFADN